MLEYFTYKKVKKHNAEKKVKQEAAKQAKASADAAATEEDVRSGTSKLLKGKGRDDGGDGGQVDVVLRPDDERFIAELLAEHDGPAPPLPPRVNVSDIDWRSDNEATVPETGAEIQKHSAVAGAAIDKEEGTEDGEKTGKAKAVKTGKNRILMLFTRHGKPEEGLQPGSGSGSGSGGSAPVSASEAEREKKDLGRVLERLSLSAQDNKAILSLSGGGDTSDSGGAVADVLQSFTQVFKDLVNGVPTAADDLARLVEDRDGVLARGYDRLPSSLRKLVAQLPDKVLGSLGPELLAAAAKSQGIKVDTDAGAGLKGTAKKVLLPQNITELVTKPGAVVAMLRAIVEALKTRWPAFIGMNVLWSVALSLLLFVLWYCYKRGREVRLEREKLENAIDGGDRVEELPDDPALPAPAAASAPAAAAVPAQEASGSSTSRTQTDIAHFSPSEEASTTVSNDGDTAGKVTVATLSKPK